MINPHALTNYYNLQLAQVIDNDDPDGRGRLQVRLHATEIEIWASLITASANNGYGVSMFPKIDEVVVVAFITPEFPLVLGSIWNGQSSQPEEAQATEDKYTIKTPAGTVMVFDDSDGPRMEVKTPQGHRINISDAEGGVIEIERGAQSVKLTTTDIEIKASVNVKVQASMVNVEASMVEVKSGMANFSGVVKCSSLITNAVISSSYTPGAGNIW